MKTILHVLQSGIEYLQKHNCSEARATMQHLLAHVLQCNRMELYTQFDRPLDDSELSTLRNLIKRKAAGEPLQHLLGSTEFFRRSFITDSRALIPRPETEELVELILQRIPHTETRILDMGTGSGVIGITLALELQQYAPYVMLADNSPAALSLALENALQLGPKVDLVYTDLFDNLSDYAHAFHVIAANLPYIGNHEQLAPEVLHDPHTALFGGDQGWELIDRFLQQAKNYLAPNGFVALEIGYDQAPVVSRLMQQYGYSRIEIVHDMNGIARFPIAYC